MTGEVETQTGFGFADGVMGVADVGDDEVGFFSELEGLVDGRLCFGIRIFAENIREGELLVEVVAAFGMKDFRFVAKEVFEAQREG